MVTHALPRSSTLWIAAPIAVSAMVYRVPPCATRFGLRCSAHNTKLARQRPPRGRETTRPIRSANGLKPRGACEPALILGRKDLPVMSVWFMAWVAGGFDSRIIAQVV